MRHHLRAEMKTTALFLLVLLCTSTTHAEHLLDDYYRLKLDMPEVEEPDVSHLLSLADQRCNENPNDADTWLSAGVLRAAHAKILGVQGLSTLKQAKRDLERSIALNPNWLDGYARAFLARLYLTVPRWPLSFRNKKAGAALLSQVLSNTPSSLPGNLYEAFRLADRNRGDQAIQHFELAATAKLACDCPSWQQYLRRQALSGHTRLTDPDKAEDL